MALSIMNYALNERIPSETLKGYYVAPEVTDDPDNGSTAILLEPVSPDDYRTGAHGTVRVLLPSGLRVVESVSVGVWVSED